MNNLKLTQIETGEWLYKGCFIQKQNHPSLMPYHVFQDTETQQTVGTCYTFTEAKKLCELYKVDNPIHTPKDYL